jgi:hypothetical protein
MNGDMQIHQRGGTTQITTSDGMAVDRFKVSTRVTSYDATWSQSTTVPSGQGFTTSLKCDVNGTASPSGSANYLLGQRFEGQHLQHLKFGTSSAESLTIQFWVRSSKTGTYCFQARSLDDVKSCIVEYTISSADTWEKKTFTISGNTANDFDNDNLASLEFCWHLSVGTDDDNETASSSWGVGSNSFVTTSNQVNLFDSATAEWYITGIQVEVGDQATDFEHLPHDVQFTRCCRYYWKPVQGNASTSEYVGLGDFYSSTQVDTDFRHITPMRTQPTLDQGTGTDYYKYYYGQTADGTVDGAWTYWIGNEHISSIYATASDAVGTSNAGKACRIIAQTTGGANAYLALSAEL